MDRDEARQRLLEAAEELFYAHGVRAIGMDKVRDRSGVSLARLYELFPSKQHLVEGYLRARDERWRRRLREYVDEVAGQREPHERLLAVFDWLGLWFAEPGFHGCGFINAWAEASPEDTLVMAAVREHKTAFRDYLTDLAAERQSHSVLEQLYLLAEGAIVTAAIAHRPQAAADAHAAVANLLGPPG